MAKVYIDIDFKPPREAIREAVEEGAVTSAYLIKQKSDKYIHIGRWTRAIYKKGKYKGKTWTSRRPARLKRSGKVMKSKFKYGGAIVMYGSFNAFYGFMHHWGTKKIKANKFLKKAEYEAAGDIKKEITERIKAKLK